MIRPTIIAVQIPDDIASGSAHRLVTVRTYRPDASGQPTILVERLEMSRADLVNLVIPHGGAIVLTEGPGHG